MYVCKVKLGSETAGNLDILTSTWKGVVSHALLFAIVPSVTLRLSIK